MSRAVVVPEVKSEIEVLFDSMISLQRSLFVSDKELEQKTLSYRASIAKIKSVLTKESCPRIEMDKIFPKVKEAYLWDIDFLLRQGCKDMKAEDSDIFTIFKLMLKKTVLSSEEKTEFQDALKSCVIKVKPTPKRPLRATDVKGMPPLSEGGKVTMATASSAFSPPPTKGCCVIQ